MKILSLHDPFPETDAAITIGAFDGIHLGHQMLFKDVIKTKSPSCVITFTKHPKELFQPSAKNFYLSDNEQKSKWCEEIGIAYMLMLPFTKELMGLSYKEFLIFLRKKTGFTRLILGKGSAFGKNKEGTEEKVKQIEKELGFTSSYIEPILVDGVTVSSSEIRKRIQNKDLKGAEKMLARPYTLLPHFSNYILPPAGDYLVTVKNQTRILSVSEKGTLLIDQQKPDEHHAITFLA